MSYRGCYKVPAIGRSVLYLLAMRRCVGFVPTPSMRVLHSPVELKPLTALSLLHFLNSRLNVFIPFSAFPFDWWYCGDDVLWSKFHGFAKTVNFSEAKCARLSGYLEYYCTQIRHSTY